MEQSLLNLCSWNSKSHFARNFLANRQTNLTLFDPFGSRSNLLIRIILEALLLVEHYCTYLIST